MVAIVADVMVASNDLSVSGRGESVLGSNLLGLRHNWNSPLPYTIILHPAMNHEPFPFSAKLCGANYQQLSSEACSIPFLTNV